jgi:pantoate--beta-alanine ligase
VTLLKVQTIPDIRRQLDPIRAERRVIGLVPTMGALHAGHASLIKRAREECDTVVVSIFVNPLQFGPDEDYLRYPRPIEKDLAVCSDYGVDLVFAPEVGDIYTVPQLTFAEVTRLDAHLCGPFRPGHFRGVATVVLKLFNITCPDRAYFGEKDYQQLCIIRRMVEDLNLAVTIVPMPIFREPDGLAMSSRNVYLQPGERASATVLIRALETARKSIQSGERKPDVVKEAAKHVFSTEGSVRPDYLEIVDTREVQPVSEITGAVRIAGAVWVGRTRLIDNVEASPS